MFYYKLDKSTPPLVKEVFEEKGWAEVPEDDEEVMFHVHWKCQRFKPSEVTSCQPNQRLNHFPKTSEISRKDLLYRNIRTMRATWGAVFDFIPLTFLLPTEYLKFVRVYSEQKEKEKKIWIAKPTDMSQGKKIFLFRELGDLSYDRPNVLQEYISNPLLLNGYKFDLRLYVLVTSFKPLCAYLYDDGLVRFATMKYDTSNLDDLFSHLTNTSINKFSPTLSDDKDGIGPGCKWRFGQLFALLESRGVDFSHLWSRIKSIILLTLLSACPIVPAAPSCFELFGFDVIIDDTLKPWLLEVNASPALNTDEPTDLAPMLSAVMDALELRDDPLPAKQQQQSATGTLRRPGSKELSRLRPAAGAALKPFAPKRFGGLRQIFPFNDKTASAFSGPDEKIDIRTIVSEIRSLSSKPELPPCLQEMEMYSVATASTDAASLAVAASAATDDVAGVARDDPCVHLRTATVS